MTIVKNREFIRNYKDFKEKLVEGFYNKIVIPQKSGVRLIITVEKSKAPFEILKEKVEKKPIIGLKRPKEDLF